MAKLRGLLLRLTFAVAFFFVLLEVMLRLFVHKLPHPIANDIVLCYSARSGGMYFVDHPSLTNFLLPNTTLKGLFNGHQWQHRTDARGFRNPPNTESEVVLLGDSFIYGHGVEEAETVAAYLRKDHGWKVYNLARQGDFLTAQYLMLKLYFPELKPKKVILFPFVNDFGDILTSRSQEAIVKPPELDEAFVEGVRQRVQSGRERGREGTFYDWLYTYRLQKILRQMRKRSEPGGPSVTAPWLAALLEEDKFKLISTHYELLFVDMLRICREGGAELEVVYVDTATDAKEWIETEKRMDTYLRDLCARHKVPFASTRSLLKGHPERLLVGDGHLSPAGHKALADFLAQPRK